MADTDEPTSGDEILVKCVLLGSTNVGKTSLVHYIIYDEPTHQSTITVGAQHCKLTLSVPVNDPVTKKQATQVFKLSLWDTGGQERFSATSPIYIRGSQVAIITVSTDDDMSIQSELGRFLKLLNDHAPEAHYIFALNKCDLVTDAEALSRVNEVRETLLELLPPEAHDQISVIPCSAFSGVGVHEPGPKFQEYFDKEWAQRKNRAELAFPKQPPADPSQAPTTQPVSTIPDHPAPAAIVPQLVEYLIKLASDGTIVSRNKKNKSLIVDLNQAPQKKTANCCGG